MTTEDFIEEIIAKSMKAYKKDGGNCLEGRKLSRHEPVMIQGYEFCCWREYVVFKVCEYLKEKCPTAEVECFLEGNDSRIEIALDDKEKQQLTTTMYLFLKSLEK